MLIRLSIDIIANIIPDLATAHNIIMLPAMYVWTVYATKLCNFQQCPTHYYDQLQFNLNQTNSAAILYYLT